MPLSFGHVDAIEALLCKRNLREEHRNELDHGTWHQNRTENGDCLIRKLNYNDSN